jgi:hypothetical protein
MKVIKLAEDRIFDGKFRCKGEIVYVNDSYVDEYAVAQTVAENVIDAAKKDYDAKAEAVAARLEEIAVIKADEAEQEKIKALITEWTSETADKDLLTSWIREKKVRKEELILIIQKKLLSEEELKKLADEGFIDPELLKQDGEPIKESPKGETPEVGLKAG